MLPVGGDRKVSEPVVELTMCVSSNIFRTASLVLCLLLAFIPWADAVRQVKHDKGFQPDYILRVTEATVPIACRTRFSALVNGILSLFRFCQFDLFRTQLAVL